MPAGKGHIIEYSGEVGVCLQHRGNPGRPQGRTPTCGRKSFLGSIASAELFSARAHFAGSAICDLRVPAHGSCETEVRIYRQREPVIGDACVNSMFEAEQPHDFLNLAGVTAHDRRATVGKDRTANPCPFTPAELRRNWSVPNHGTVLFADHRPSHCRSVADVDVDTAK